MWEAQQLVRTQMFEVDVWDALSALQWRWQRRGWNVPSEAPLCRGVCTTGARGAPVALCLRRSLTDTEHRSPARSVRSWAVSGPGSYSRPEAPGPVSVFPTARVASWSHQPSRFAPPPHTAAHSQRTWLSPGVLAVLPALRRRSLCD